MGLRRHTARRSASAGRAHRERPGGTRRLRERHGISGARRGNFQRARVSVQANPRVGPRRERPPGLAVCTAADFRQHGHAHDRTVDGRRAHHQRGAPRLLGGLPPYPLGRARGGLRPSRHLHQRVDGHRQRRRRLFAPTPVAAEIRRAAPIPDSAVGAGHSGHHSAGRCYNARVDHLGGKTGLQPRFCFRPRRRYSRGRAPARHSVRQGGTDGGRPADHGRGRRAAEGP